MNKLEREQMLQRRQALLTLMEGDFAPIEKVPVSKHVASAIWFKNAGLADILETYGLCCFRFKVFSGKVVAAFEILWKRRLPAISPIGRSLSPQHPEISVLRERS